MKTDEIVIITLLVIFFILLLYLTIYYHNNNIIISTNSSSTTAVPISWGKTTPSSDPYRSECLLYQFPDISISGQTYAPTPSLDSNILNRLNGIPPGDCYDTDQIVAQQLQRTCIQNDLVENAISNCWTTNGERAPIGYQETYYGTCTDFRPCTGSLGYLALNFGKPNCQNNNISSSLCLTKLGQTQVGFETCSLRDDRQKWRLNRTSPTIYPSLNSDGNIGQIYDRVSQQCLIVQNGKTQLGDCTDSLNWWMVPPLQDGNLISSPQFVYLGNVDPRELPTDPGQYLNFIRTNGLLSMAPNNQSNLAPYANNSQTIAGQQQSAQFINQTLFNPILNSPICPCPGCIPWVKQ